MPSTKWEEKSEVMITNFKPLSVCLGGPDGNPCEGFRIEWHLNTLCFRQAKKGICKDDPSSDGNGLDADESHVQGGLMCPVIEVVENK